MTGEVTQLLTDLKNGHKEAAERLIPLVYDELRRLAGHYMAREAPDHTLQATALVHEAYLRLVDQRRVDWRDRAHFIAVAAQLMRRILLNYARERNAAKRGGGRERVLLEEKLLVSEVQLDQVIAIDEALQRLAQKDAQQSRIVELSFFGGLTEEETAEVLGVSTKTVQREWKMARAWLYRELGKGQNRLR
jgi:RNA polymerase sigma factor (TIGR02999 family)